MEISPQQSAHPRLSEPAGYGGDAMVALKEHEPALRKLVAAKLNGQGDASVDDVLQEVAISIQREGAMEAVEPSRIGSWLRQVAIHKVQDYWRGVGRLRRLSQRFSEHQEVVAGGALSPFEWVAKFEERNSVTEALRTLPQEDRSILELKYYQGMNYREIAEELGLSQKTLEYRLSRARNSLRQSLEAQPAHIPNQT